MVRRMMKPQLKLLISSNWQRAVLFFISGLCVGHYMFKDLTPEQRAFSLLLAGSTGLPLLARVPAQETKTKSTQDFKL